MFRSGFGTSICRFLTGDIGARSSMEDFFVSSSVLWLSFSGFVDDSVSLGFVDGGLGDLVSVSVSVFVILLLVGIEEWWQAGFDLQQQKN